MVKAAKRSESVHVERMCQRSSKAVRVPGIGRRGILQVAVVIAVAVPEAGSSRLALLQEYLERSKKNKAKYDKERLDDYYKRNYKEYFDLVGGAVERKKEEDLSEAEKGIREWLRRNK